MNDAELIQQALTGSEESFRLLLERHRGVMWRVAWRIALNDEDALDICQEVALRLWRNLATLRLDSPVEPWLRTVTAREALRWMNRNGHVRHHLGLDHPEALTDPNLHCPPTAATNLAKSERDSRVQQALLSLSPCQRTAFSLRFHEDLPLRDIADAMACSEGAVKQHLFRAVERLRTLLRKDG